jgi:glucose-1-phosphate thymidylyltransferase
MGRGFAWLDTGTHASLLDAANFRAHADRTAGHAERARPRKSPMRKGWISDDQLRERISLFTKNAYGGYLKSLL